MRQHPINLLPDSIRVRAEAGVRVRRATATFIAATAIVIILAVHARVELHSALEAHAITEARANHALAMEAKSNELQAIVDDMDAFIGRYDRIESPIDMSQLLSTLINALPSSMALERIDLHTAKNLNRSPRGKGTSDAPRRAPRSLVGEIAGVAASDRHIAELVAELESREPFRDVSLDFSRSKPVRGHSARAFRLSFRVDFNVRYEIERSNKKLAEAIDVE